MSNQKLLKINRYYKISQIFFCITPFIAYIYISLSASMLSISFQDILTSNTQLLVIFIIAMLNPYIAYLLSLIKNKLTIQSYEFVVINLILLFISQLLTLNYFYLILLGIVFYKTIQIYNIDIKYELSHITLKSLFGLSGGSLIIIVISSLCLYATLQLK